MIEEINENLIKKILLDFDSENRNHKAAPVAFHSKSVDEFDRMS